MPQSFAFLRGSRASISELFAFGAEERFVEPPLPFVPIEKLDTPNADHLASLFFDLTRTGVDEGESAGSALFEACAPVFEDPAYELAVFELPERFVEALSALDDEDVPWTAASVITFPVHEEVPKNPFTNEPLFNGSDEAYRAHLRKVHEGLVAEIRALRSFFLAARAAHERVCLWTDHR
jgi:hypothetical protein